MVIEVKSCVEDFNWALKIAKSCNGWVEERYIRGKTLFFVLKSVADSKN